MGVKSALFMILSLPQPIRFVIGGGLGTLIQLAFFSYFTYNRLTSNLQETEAYALSFIVNIPIQHFIHHKISFINSEVNYFTSLIRSYLSYAVNLLIASLIAFVILESIGVIYWLGFLMTNLLAAISMFIILKVFAFEDREILLKPKNS